MMHAKKAKQHTTACPLNKILWEAPIPAGRTMIFSILSFKQAQSTKTGTIRVRRDH
ncbi:hypothetical protein SKAU_G00146150 [Synaphobranchus kaupii]|uniref:Uncharacterized protein n=1 Tax=Synaphobranchus kaupii TaxID=118154 RepID=A0A9Q1FTM6_SYNKA|nr:hypothetical protein SKAU_G00146150 [Synaphobranchus kaupii]